MTAMQTNLMQCAAYGLSTDRLTPPPSTSAAMGCQNGLNYIHFFTKILSKFNLKGINSVREKKYFGFSPEATRGRIEQNITKCTFLQSRAGQYEKFYLFIFGLICGIWYITVFCIWIK